LQERGRALPHSASSGNGFVQGRRAVKGGGGGEVVTGGSIIKRRFRGKREGSGGGYKARHESLLT